MIHRVTIIYATETGNSEEASFSLLKDIAKVYPCDCRNISDYDIMNLPSCDHVIFIISTAGDGDFPRSMLNSWKFLIRKALPSNCLSNVHFTVFGLGDSSYEKYNASARKLFIRLKQLGAEPFLELGLGDYQANYGYHKAFFPWKRKLIKYIENTLQPPEQLFENDDLNFSYQICISKSEFPDEKNINMDKRKLCVFENNLLTHPEWIQESRNLIFTTDSSFHSEPFDTISVYYRNNKDLVNLALSLFCPALDKEDIVQITLNQCASKKTNCLGDLSCSLKNLFEYYLDISGIPNQSFFFEISQYANDIEEKQKLVELSSENGFDLFYEYVIQERRNYLEIILDFKSIKAIPLEIIVKLIPRIIPRAYSISASYYTGHDCRIELCVTIVKYKTKFGRSKFGSCTEFLSNLKEGDIVYFDFCPNNAVNKEIFLYNQKPLILIGTGSGIAPIRYLITWLSNKQVQREILLIFGCRKKDKDFLYAEEWKRLKNIKNNFDYLIAFSREEKKEYVMNKIIDSQKLIYQYICQGASIFVCGSSNKMPNDTKNAIISVIMNQGNIQYIEAEKKMTELISSKNYYCESWSS